MDKREDFVVLRFQAAIAEVLGVPRNRIEVKAKRLGGGFGGKETRNVPLYVWTAMAANRTQRPVRIMLDRDEDMAISGTRHPSLIKYKASEEMEEEGEEEEADEKKFSLQISLSEISVCKFMEED